jgi:hypothetical protein
MMYLYCIALLLILGKYLNHLRIENASLRLKNKFTILNVRLYELLDSGRASRSDEHFRFLIESTETSEMSLARVSFWHIVYFAYTRRKEPGGNYLEFQKEFENPELKKILNEYTKLSYDYFVSKNFFSICFFNMSLSCITFITSLFHSARGISFRKNFNRDFKYFIISKENPNVGVLRLFKKSLVR